MSNQLSLFDQTSSSTAELHLDPDQQGPGARTTDPATSHAAWHSLAEKLPKQRALVLVAVCNNSLQHNGSTTVHHGVTAPELAKLLDRQQSVMSKRLSELVTAGLLYEDGTRLGASGRQVTIYQPTTAGLAAAADLA
jgi:hypothetical protein